MVAIIGSGLLASRETQEQVFGKSVFNSGSQGDDIGKSSTHKHVDQEKHQVVFQVDRPYTYYMDGVAFIFPTNQVLSRAQFMFADGIHVFDPEYSTLREDSPGFAIDLREFPFVVAVRSDKADDLRKALVDQDSIEDIDAWWSKHVVTFEKGTSVQEINQAANELFLKQDLQEVKQGAFLPTGQRGETASRSTKPLLGYVSTELRRKLNSVESRRLPSQQIIELISQDAVDVDILFKLFNIDDELHYCFKLNASAIEEHTKKVLALLEEYFPDLDKDKKILFRILTILHDVGKAESFDRSGNYRSQHKYTIPILRRVMQELRFNREDIELAVAVVDQELLGDFFGGMNNLENTVKLIVDKAKELNINAVDYLELVYIHYMTDAGAYTTKAGDYTGIFDSIIFFDEHEKAMRLKSDGEWGKDYLKMYGKLIEQVQKAASTSN